MRSFQRWHNAGFTSELVPVIPPGAPLTPGSNVRDGHRGKVPGVLTQAGTWSGLGGQWSQTLTATEADVRKWHGWKANVGLQGRKHPGVDIDINDSRLADLASELVGDYLGRGPIRSRTSSPRRLHVFALEPGAPALRKVRLAFFRPGHPVDADDKPDAVELLGFGQQYVVDGSHPSGGEYIFDGEHPCDCGPSGLPTADAPAVERLFGALREALSHEGCAVTKESGTTAGAIGGLRKSIDDPSLRAPSPAAVVELLKAWPNTLESHNDFVAASPRSRPRSAPTVKSTTATWRHGRSAMVATTPTMCARCGTA